MKVLIVGLGSIAKKHIAALRQCDPEVEVYALRSSSDARPYERVHDWHTWMEALTLRYDFVIISNPTSLHRQVIDRLKDSRIPLFIEKPLFDSLQGEELVEELKRRQIPTYVACNLRFLEVVRSLHQLLQNVIVNEVNVYCGSYLPDWRPGSDYHRCYSAIPELGGGVHIDLIHEIDYVYWLFGQPRRVHKVFSNKSSLNIRACDYANYLLEYSAFNVSIILNYYRRDSKRVCELVTDKGTYTANLLDNTLSNAQGQILKQYPQRIVDTYLAQMRFFLSMLETGNFNFNTVEEAYNVLKICLE